MIRAIYDLICNRPCGQKKNDTCYKKMGIVFHIYKQQKKAIKVIVKTIEECSLQDICEDVDMSS